MSDETQSRERRIGPVVLLWVFVVFVVYLLSTGPAVLLYRSTNSAVIRRTAEVVYSPVEYMCWWEPFDRALDWYMSKWDIDFKN